MLLDPHSLFIAIGVSCTALALTLLATWIVARSETYLLTWSTGLALTVASLLFYLGVERYEPDLQLITFLLLIIGFGLIYRGTIQFCAHRSSWIHVVIVTASGVVPTVAAFALGYTGIGTATANIAVGVLTTLAAYQYWKARREAPLLMVTNALLYFVTAMSFMACGAVLMANGQYILTERPMNWAEEFNSLMVIVGLTGIGALSLTINQIRTTNRHKSDAMTDPLTGLLNRRALFNDKPLATPSNTAILVMDLDHFKNINDDFGHAAGDRVLRAFAEIIFSNIRAIDLAARLGGEEFCIVLSSSSPKAASVVAERIRTTFEAKTFQTPAGPINATVSVGVAIQSSEPETLQALLSRADAALYQAKAAGRNRVHISDFHLAA
ncbi:GGDEF domain-containing protein [Tardiphaga alba]|uniref:diguanylate cyclase n=1 Tax=Tardiphaga alba TaxID=340268 RepID=A0ABX8AD20_9BRAD|nr:GGDEF domain-containing protein [Tardiphaga alba]QUS40534.1 GGDEF domain-containing protein [Tardiphaga alba]